MGENCGPKTSVWLCAYNYLRGWRVIIITTGIAKKKDNNNAINVY